MPDDRSKKMSIIQRQADANKTIQQYMDSCLPKQPSLSMSVVVVCKCCQIQNPVQKEEEEEDDERVLTGRTSTSGSTYGDDESLIFLCCAE
jgi:hypothetical protein